MSGTSSGPGGSSPDDGAAPHDPPTQAFDRTDNPTEQLPLQQDGRPFGPGSGAASPPPPEQHRTTAFAPQPGQQPWQQGRTTAGPSPTGATPAGLPPFGGQQPPSFGGQAPPPGMSAYGRPQPGMSAYGRPQPGTRPGQLSPGGPVPQPGSMAGPLPPGGKHGPQGKPPRSSADRRRRRTILIIAAVVVVVLVAGLTTLGLVQRSRAQAEQEAREAQERASQEAAQQAAVERADAATGAVEDYLDALADGDAEASLALLYNGQFAEYVTDELLARSAEIAPIADVEVSGPAELQEGDTMGIPVDATFSLGEERVEQQFVVSAAQDGAFTIGQGGLRTIWLENAGGLPMTVNGVAVEGDRVELPIGGYELAIAAEHLALGGDATILVSNDNVTPEVWPRISDAGQEAFRAAVREAVDACLGSRELEAGCGIDLDGTLDDNTEIIGGTIDRSLTGEAQGVVDGMTAELLSFDTPTVGIGDPVGAIDVVSRCRVDGEEYEDCTYTGLPSMGRPSIDFADPELTVDWY